jgi:putative hydrolase of the HAD superfamily
LLDLGGVLVGLEPERFRAHWARLGVPADRLERFLAGDRNADWNLGRIPTEDFPRLLRRELQVIGWPAERLREAWNSLIGEPLTEMVALAADAAAAGMRVGLLSNTDPWHWETAFFRLAFRDFDPLGLSYELAALKPDPAAFRHSLAAGSAELPRPDPARTLYVDDREENLVTAASLGFQTWLHPAGQNDASALRQRLGLQDEGTILEL